MADWPSVPTQEYFFRTNRARATRIAFSAAVATISSALTPGLWEIQADTAWHWANGPVTSGANSQVAAASTDMVLEAFERHFVWVWETSDTAYRNDAISARARSGSGYFHYARVL